SRTVIPLHFQEGWSKAIASGDKSQVRQVAERIVRDAFLEVPRRRGLVEPTTPAAADVTAASPRPALDYSATVEGSFGQHRDGWEFVLQNLMARMPHDSAAVGLDAFVEKTFAWEYGSRSTFPEKPWIAISHKPTEIPDFYGWRANMEFYQAPYFFPRARSL